MPIPLDPESLVRLLAAHPVLPPGDVLPARSPLVRELLADLAQGEQSRHVERLRVIAGAEGISVEELARRARFLLICLELPRVGTHYDVLGVSRAATTREIRSRFAELIRLHHPDRVGPGGGWLEEQARRLIEAYETLRDQERREDYDRRLEAPPHTVPVDASPAAAPWSSRPSPLRWAPAAILATGVLAAAVLYARPARVSPPGVAAPSNPRILESWHPGRSLDVATTRASQATPILRAPRSTDRDEATHERVAPSFAARAERDRTEGDRIEHRRAERDRIERERRTEGDRIEHHRAERDRIERERGGIAPAAMSAAASAAPGASAAPDHGRTRIDDAPRDARTLGVDLTLHARPRDPEPVMPAAAPGAVRAGLTATPHGQDAAGPPPPADDRTQPGRSAPAAPAPPPRAPSPSARPGEALSTVEAFRHAYERKDLATVMTLMGERPRDRGVAGRAAVESLYAGNFDSLRTIRYDVGDLTVHAGEVADSVRVRGRFWIRASRAGWFRPRIAVAGPIEWTLRLEQGALRIVAIDYEVTEQ